MGVGSEKHMFRLQDLKPYEEKIMELLEEVVDKAKNKDILRGFWQPFEISGIKPESREGSTILSLMGKVYLFGGFGRDRFNEIYILDTGNLIFHQIR
jgi:hypothetical protein